MCQGWHTSLKLFSLPKPAPTHHLDVSSTPGLAWATADSGPSECGYGVWLCVWLQVDGRGVFPTRSYL